MKNLGLTGEYLLRIFGLKDGLEFYNLDRENQGEYTDFCTNGPPGVGVSIHEPGVLLCLTLVIIALPSWVPSRTTHIRTTPYIVRSATWN